MRCPHCSTNTLHGQPSKRGDQVTVCTTCRGVWLDQGQLHEFTSRPRELEAQLREGLGKRKPSNQQCPRCSCGLEEGWLDNPGMTLDECPECGGLWFNNGELDRVVAAGPGEFDLDGLQPPPPDPELQARAHERHHALKAGLVALPNLFLRSALTLIVLYGIVGLVLIGFVEFRDLSPTLALVIGVAFAILQFVLGPYIHDLCLQWIYDFRWIEPDELPDHLRAFVERVCAEHKIRFPYFGLIRDGAPTAFTYGHTPRNARVVISKGILKLLEPEEVEAVVAHELGHVRHWDMAMMTLANLVPLILYYLYRVGMRIGGGNKKEGGWAVAVAIGSYVLYIVSEYIVLWFSRTREYYADRFAGEVTGNPSALAKALVKIAYGLAARQSKEKEKEAAKAEASGKKVQEKGDKMGGLRVLNIFDDRAATALVMASNPKTEAADELHPEDVKSAMQWDLWNPWALYYELNSTHPLVAKRLLALSDQAASLGQEPFITFDRRKPESYWDDFLVDVVMLWLPVFGILFGAAAFLAEGLLMQRWNTVPIAAGVMMVGLCMVFQLRFKYRRDFFPHLSVAALLHKVKVSGIRPVPATLTGKIIGKGVPGLIWSEDFVMQDRTGILFLDYRQPLAIWNWLFGLFRAGRYQGKEVRVTGWFRRAPVPFLELWSLEVLDGSEPSRRTYSYITQVVVAWVIVAAGAAWAAAALLIR